MHEELRQRLMVELSRCARYLHPRVLARELELLRLRTRTRRAPTTTRLLGPAVHVPDGLSFYWTYRSIFEQQVYAFRPASPAPRILDCGANIGLSAIWFARTYPGARITAFEPDPQLFDVLRRNVAAAGAPDRTTLHAAALWDRDTDELSFEPDGADAGRVAGESAAGPRVRGVRLARLLDEPVDLLKLDIEGAEVRVLTDCSDRLDRVANLFVEYHSYAGQPQELDRLFAILQRAGFRVHVHGDPRSPSPLLARATDIGMDLRLQVFGFREAAR